MDTEVVLSDRAVLSEDLPPARFPLSPASQCAIHNLPALPAPHRHGGTYESSAFTYFTAEQMYEYALAERERCANLCETLNHGAFGSESYLTGIRDGSVGCANWIRAAKEARNG